LYQSVQIKIKKRLSQKYKLMAACLHSKHKKRKIEVQIELQTF
jgi:hypothetical protein